MNVSILNTHTNWMCVFNQNRLAFLENEAHDNYMKHIYIDIDRRQQRKKKKAAVKRKNLFFSLSFRFVSVYLLATQYIFLSVIVLIFTTCIGLL